MSMAPELLVAILISEAISLILIVRMWLRGGSVFTTLVVTVFTLVPFVGPVFYLFCTDTTPPQPVELQNRGPRGEYMHTWITMKPLFKEFLDQRKRQAKADEHDT